MNPKLRLGRIIWAERPDPQGRNSKKRPWVILSPDAEVQQGLPLRAIAISTRSEDFDPLTQVELPWGPGQERGTKLKIWCVAVCSWLTLLQVDDIADDDIGGVVPVRSLVAIQRIIAETGAAQPEQPPPVTS